MTSKKIPDHWSDYWSRGHLTSLPEDFSSNYDGELAGFWNEAFRSLPAEGAMIDLCTGNGAIALLAAAWAERHAPGLRITAVDAAAVDTGAIRQNHPAAAALLDRVEFIDNCRVEDLDLPDAQFDLATSQYGIEYCDWERAAAKVARLLKPGGRMVMVAHTAGSDILKFMQRERGEYALLEQLAFFSTIRDYLDRKMAFQGFRQSLAGIRQRLNVEFGRTGSPLFRSVLGMLNGALQMDRATLEKGREHLESYLAQTRFGYERLKDMLRVNQAIRADAEWYRVFESAGLELQESGELLYRGQHHAGEYLKFARPAEVR
jgi:ubiquinone/menaquinone biosynthesis C-methylase UbiE